MKTVMRVGGGGVAVKSERDNRDAVEQLLGQSLCSTDLRVTRLYDPISLLYFIAAKHQHVCLPASHPPRVLDKFKRH